MSHSFRKPRSHKSLVTNTQGLTDRQACRNARAELNRTIERELDALTRTPKNRVGL